MSPSADKAHEPGKTQVPGQLLGYGLQYTRMTALLLEADEDATVSLEVFEDVGVTSAKNTLASQTKSSTTDNPVSDRAKPLWKTLGNWLDAVEAGQLPLKSTLFELYVFGDFHGQICSLFSAARNETEAIHAIHNARGILKADGKQVPEHISSVLNADQAILVPLIVQFRYGHGSGSSVDDLKNQFGKALIPTEFLDTITTYAIGWVKEQVDRLIEKGSPAAISVKTFRTEISSYARSVAFSAGLADLAGAAVPDIESNKTQFYVRQLDLIAVTDERKLRAISSYLRASFTSSNNQLQIIVLDHAAGNVWAGIEGIKQVDDWREGRKLVPADWL